MQRDASLRHSSLCCAMVRSAYEIMQHAQHWQPHSFALADLHCCWLQVSSSQARLPCHRC